METPDKDTQKAIVTQVIKAIEVEAYSLKIAGEAFKTIGIVEKAEEKATQLANTMQLHAFYASKLAELT